MNTSSRTRKPKPQPPKPLTEHHVPQQHTPHPQPQVNKPLTRSATKANQGFPTTADKEKNAPATSFLSPSPSPSPNPSRSFSLRTSGLPAVGKLVFQAENESSNEGIIMMLVSLSFLLFI